MNQNKSIQTFVRIRPHNSNELNSWPDKLTAAVRADDKTIVFNPSDLQQATHARKFSTSRARLNFDQKYTFDRVFDMDSSEQEIYHAVVLPRLQSLLDGINASLFAYGATGCGKTHTISAFMSQLCIDLFSTINAKLESNSDTSINVSATYLQLYNDKMLDLLPVVNGNSALTNSGQKKSHSQLLLLERGVVGLKQYPVCSAQDLETLLAEGKRHRVIAATKANSESSRSHAILTLHVEQKIGNTIQRSQLSIIDLAGSERAQGTVNSGKLIREGANINQSLLALGNCIKARESRSAYIPYRSSKLTRILRPSLDGSCDTAMIVCLSPSYKNFDDSKNSLEYGKRCSNIRGGNITRTTSPLSMVELSHQVQQLQRQMNVAGQQLTLVREERDALNTWYETFLEVFPALRTVVEEKGGVHNVNREDILDFFRSSPSEFDCRGVSGLADIFSSPSSRSALSSPGKRRRS